MNSTETAAQAVAAALEAIEQMFGYYEPLAADAAALDDQDDYALAA